MSCRTSFRLDVEIHRLSPAVAIWHRFDSGVKADLFATALSTAAGVFLIDPIELKPAEVMEVVGQQTVTAILLTNGNHARASRALAVQLQVPVHASPDAGIPGVVALASGAELEGGVRVLGVDGAGPGEAAFLDTRDGGTMVVGDAIINFGSHGFTFLPAKYCSNPKQMHKSLQLLAAHPFERLLFAHGTPIMSGARDRLLRLLAQSAT